MRNYNELKIYHHAHKLSIKVYEISAKLPKEEQYSLTNQIRRAIVSVVANIVEGCSRDSNKDFKHFLSISIGSLCEVEALLILSNDLYALEQKQYQSALSEIISLRKMITTFKKNIPVS